MLQHLKTELKPALLMLIIFTILTGGIYTFLTTAAVQVLFPEKANGSLITMPDGTIIGSTLIGQNFTGERYFWGRPSENGSASNLSPTSQKYLEKVTARVQNLKKFTSEISQDALIPIDLVTASGSGLDPDISPAAAYYQVERVAKARKLPLTLVQQLVDTSIIHRQLGFLGETRVNVLKLNLNLDALEQSLKTSRIIKK